MKWVGQHIWNFISRFRSDVYLEDLTESAQDHVIGVDADGKLYKQDTSVGDVTGVDITVGTGLDISQSNTTGGDYTSTISLDLTEVINSDLANRVLTSDGDGTLTAESGLNVSGTITTINGINDVKITPSVNGLGYGPDIVGTAANMIALGSYNVFGTGAGGILEQQDFTSGTVSGAHTAWKGGGSNGTNQPGGDMHVIAGRGTGSQPGGSFKFWSSAAGSSGSSYNTSAIKFMIDSVGNITSYGNLTFVGGGDGIIFEGTTPDDHETTFVAGEPTADRTITLPDATGTVALTSDLSLPIYRPRSIMVCRHPSDLMFYMWRRDQWHAADGDTQMQWGTGSTPNTTLAGTILARQVSMPLVVAISNMQIYKVTMNWRWGSKQPGIAGNRPFEFSFHTSTPPNNSQAEQTLSTAITATNNNSNYQSDYQYITTWDFNSGNGVSLPAGQALSMFARCTHPVTTLAISTLGSIYIEYKYV